MAHIRNEEFYLYTGLTSNGNDCFEAYECLNESGIQYRHLHYGDPRQHAEVLTNVKTWFPERHQEITMPFVTYVEVYEFNDPTPKVMRVVSGIEEIKDTNWRQLIIHPN